MAGRLDELDRLEASQAEIGTLVSNTLQFISGLAFTLRQGLPQEKLVVLRQCIERIFIDKPNQRITIKLRAVPAGDLRATSEMEIELRPSVPT